MEKKQGLVKCRFCGLLIDREDPNPKRPWAMPSKNWFYHKDCYNDFAKVKKKMADITNDEKFSDDYWLQMLYDYLQKDLKMPIEEYGFVQWNRYVKQGYTPKGIYFCLRWFYDVQHGDRTKSGGGIGIVPYIYKEGCSYWVQKRVEDEEKREKIEEQMRRQKEQEVINVTIPRKKRQRNKSMDWDSILSEGK